MRFMVATELLMEHLLGRSASIVYPLPDLAVSAVTLEWIQADVELDQDLQPSERSKWRTNLTNFRKTLVQSGGEVPALSENALERWGKAMLLDLTHDYGLGPQEMPSEERLVVASASELGLIYLTSPRDWNYALENEFGLAVEVI